MKLLRLGLIVILVLSAAGVFAGADTAYFRELVNKGNASCFDACRIATILRSGQDDPKAAFESLRDNLVKDKIVTKDWYKKKADSFITRGEMAYMLFRSLRLDGGLTVRVIGLSCRYAYRECVDKELMVRGYGSQNLSGEELINILDGAGKFQEKNAGKKKFVKPEENKSDVKADKPEPKKEEPKEVKPAPEIKGPVGGPGGLKK
jgi:hypothetical protein